MRSSWAPSERSLDTFARKHFWYEVYVLTGQARELANRYPTVITDPVGDALLEASLVHLRLLDDFLGNQRQLDPPTGSSPLRVTFVDAFSGGLAGFSALRGGLASERGGRRAYIL